MSNLRIELMELRNDLKRKNMHYSSYYKKRVQAHICSDEAIHSMVNLKPYNRDEIGKINGIGDQFLEKYADQFLQIIQNHIQNDLELKKIDNQQLIILKKLTNKLVNISPRNRLLYSSKLYKKNGFDLFQSNIKQADLYNLLISSKHNSLKLYELSINDYISEKTSQSDTKKDSIARSLLTLRREWNRNVTERGINNLFIGFPYIYGKFSEEDFFVYAPLALFPVNLINNGTSFMLAFDKDRDPLFNSQLVLANNKFQRKNNVIEDPTLLDYEDVKLENFLQLLEKYYSNNGFDIKLDIITSFNKYIDKEKRGKINLPDGMFYLSNNAILGLFDTFSNAIHKDLETIIDKGFVSSTVKDLLLSANQAESEINFSYNEDENDEKTTVFKEKDIQYINDLNYSQESALAILNKGDKLVVQGPPGTGKSQLIASIVANSVLDNKNVLMVSEKKAALDVIYSRLGNANKYTVLIDDVNNKEHFYNLMVNSFEPSSKNQVIQNFDAEIELELEKLQSISNIFFDKGEFGIEPYKCYYFWNKTLYPPSHPDYSKVTEAINNSLIELSHSQIKKLKDTFNKNQLLVDLQRFDQLSNTFPILAKFSDGLSPSKIMAYSNELKLLKSHRFFSTKNRLVKIYDSVNLSKKLRLISLEVLNVNAVLNEAIKAIKSDIDHFCNGLNYFQEYNELKFLFNSLTELEESWFNQLKSITYHLDISFEDSNETVYNHLIQIRIDDFESKNVGVLKHMSSYRDIFKQLKVLHNKKKELTKSKFEVKLFDSINGLRKFKSFKEFERRLQMKRKWSISKFFKEYNLELLDGYKIWLLTPDVVSELFDVKEGMFDLVIFDEASQLYVEKALPTIQRASRVLIAGDHKQLKPSSLGRGRIDEDIEEELEEISAPLEVESLLDLARFRFPETMLNYHYRSESEELINFSNYAFYNGRLIVSPNSGIANNKPIERIFVQNGLWIDRSNYYEAKKVLEVLKETLINRKNNETIGIITFNSSQRDTIEDLIDRETLIDQEFASRIKIEIDRKNVGENVGLFVKNIENVQGDERDIIIFSVGYAKNNEGRLVRNFGWLNQDGGENRLNVAITRAKKKKIIVTSIEPEELVVDDLKNNGPKLLRKYLEYVKYVSEDRQEEVQLLLNNLSNRFHIKRSKEILFDSPFEEEVYNALSKKGYLVETQVGIGGYRIDLAILDKSNGEYILGIECDGISYHGSNEARERDFHRQKYLESRGWRIHRIWSPKWWMNSHNEIQKVMRIIEKFQK